MRVGMNELLVILLVVLVIFGPKNLPKLGKMFGKTMSNFKKGMEDVDDDDDAEDEKPAKKAKKAEKTEDEE